MRRVPIDKSPRDSRSSKRSSSLPQRATPTIFSHSSTRQRRYVLNQLFAICKLKGTRIIPGLEEIRKTPGGPWLIVLARATDFRLRKFRPLALKLYSPLPAAFVQRSRTTLLEITQKSRRHLYSAYPGPGFLKLFRKYLGTKTAAATDAAQTIRLSFQGSLAPLGACKNFSGSLRSG